MYELINRVFRPQDRALHASFFAHRAPSTLEDVVFRGRNRVESKRALIRYWTDHRQQLNMNLTQFTRRCTLLDDERTIVFKP